MKSYPDFRFETTIWNTGLHVLGIDEAGRGAFAGPLSVGGVLFDPKSIKKLLPLGINDSKLLNPKKRESLYIEIKKCALFSHVEFVSLEVINEMGIGKATFIGMEKVWRKCCETFQNPHCLIDAFRVPNIDFQTPIVHGDRLSISIAAASIIAKVERDNLMKKLSLEFPSYGFEIHKGYGTLMHRNSLKKFGPSTHHRTQFIKKFI